MWQKKSLVASLSAVFFTLVVTGNSGKCVAADFNNANLSTAISDLQSKSIQVKIDAAAKVSEIGADAKDAAPALVVFLQDKSFGAARSIAAKALGDVGASASTVSVPALTIALTDAEGGVASSAALALANIGPSARPALASLVSLLKTNDVKLRTAACYAILQIGVADEDIATILPMLSDNNDCVRSCASRTIFHTDCNASSAIPLITKLLNDKNEYVRIDAINALKRLEPDSKELTAKSVSYKNHSIANSYGKETNVLWYNDWSRFAAQ